MEDITKTAGCEKYESVKKTNVSICCPSLPKVFNKDSSEKCETECKGKGYCCKADCTLKEQKFADASGKFDATKAKELIKSLVNNAAYV
jgi:hypothetical protein